MEDRKACVRIYGQDYTISGERDEKILPMNILRQKRRFPSLRPRPARRRRIPSIT